MGAEPADEGLGGIELVADALAGRGLVEPSREVVSAGDGEAAAKQEVHAGVVDRVAARAPFEIGLVELQAGTIDIITSLNTQQTLFTDLDLLTQIRLSRFQALVNLYKALGGGWQYGAGS